MTPTDSDPPTTEPTDRRPRPAVPLPDEYQYGGSAPPSVWPRFVRDRILRRRRPAEHDAGDRGLG